MPVLQLRYNVLAKTFYLSCNTGITEGSTLIFGDTEFFPRYTVLARY